MKALSTFIISFFVLVFLFLAVPQNSYSGIAFTPLGCCVDNNSVCLGCGEFESCSIPQLQCEGALGGNFTEGQACFEQQSDGCGGPDSLPGCCIIARGECISEINLNECNNARGVGWILDESCNELVQCQTARNVPSLSQWGLIALAGILAVVGLFVIRRRAVTT